MTSSTLIQDHLSMRHMWSASYMGRQRHSVRYMQSVVPYFVPIHGHYISYNEIANDSAIEWDCIMCGCPNYSTLCYSLIFSTSNLYSVLSDTSLASPTLSNNIRPIHASTPDRKKNRRTKENASLRILNVNFQSIKGKQGQVRNLIDRQYKPRHNLWYRNMDWFKHQRQPDISFRL